MVVDDIPGGGSETGCRLVGEKRGSATVRTVIIGHGAKTSRISPSGLGGKTIPLQVICTDIMPPCLSQYFTPTPSTSLLPRAQNLNSNFHFRGVAKKLYCPARLILVCNLSRVSVVISVKC